MSKKYKNNVIIKDNNVIKKRNDKVLELYDYLETRGFENYPKIESIDENNIKTEYIES